MLSYHSCLCCRCSYVTDTRVLWLCAVLRAAMKFVEAVDGAPCASRCMCAENLFCDRPTIFGEPYYSRYWITRASGEITPRDTEGVRGKLEAATREDKMSDVVRFRHLKNAFIYLFIYFGAFGGGDEVRGDDRPHRRASGVDIRKGRPLGGAHLGAPDQASEA